MKKLLLIWFFSGSLDGHRQIKADSLLNRSNALIARCNRIVAEMDEYAKENLQDIPNSTPDTLRAIILVTLSANGIAHARMGYVVIEQGKRPVYLDCRKRALKLPSVGWGWEKVGKN